MSRSSLASYEHGNAEMLNEENTIRRAEYTDAWLGACRQAHAKSHRSLALLRMGIADAKCCLLWSDLFWFKREMSEEDWGGLKTFITEAFDLSLSCKRRLVLCTEAVDGTVQFNSGSSQPSDSTKELLARAYYDALAELRAVN